MPDGQIVDNGPLISRFSHQYHPQTAEIILSKHSDNVPLEQHEALRERVRV